MSTLPTSERVTLVPIFYFIKNQSPAPLFLLFRKRSRSHRLTTCKRAVFTPICSLPTFCGFESVSKLFAGISFVASLQTESGRVFAFRHSFLFCFRSIDKHKICCFLCLRIYAAIMYLLFSKPAAEYIYRTIQAAGLADGLRLSRIYGHRYGAYLRIFQIQHPLISVHVHAQHKPDAEVKRNHGRTAGAEKRQSYAYYRQQRKAHAYIYN